MLHTYLICYLEWLCGVVLSCDFDANRCMFIIMICTFLYEVYTRKKTVETARLGMYFAATAVVFT